MRPSVHWSISASHETAERRRPNQYVFRRMLEENRVHVCLGQAVHRRVETCNAGQHKMWSYLTGKRDWQEAAVMKAENSQARQRRAKCIRRDNATRPGSPLRGAGFDLEQVRGIFDIQA